MRLALLACSWIAACGGDAAKPDAVAADGDLGSPAGDGFHRIDVPVGDGAMQAMWIYVASPAGPGPFPVVVYGHGQGTTDAFPECSAASAHPTHADVMPSVEVANALASVGYVGISVFYRGFGEPPSLGKLIVRDHFLLDARSMLAAARWGRDRHGKGTGQVVFMGNSMGSFPATWAFTPHPALADLQAGLDLRGAIASGMLGNHIANSSPQFRSLDNPAVPINTRIAGVALFAFQLAAIRATQAGRSQLELATVNADAIDLTANGRDLLVEVFLGKPPAIAECAGVTAAYCSTTCAGAVIRDLFTSRAGGMVRTSDWFTAETITAFGFWAPPASIDPGSTSNSLLARFRDQSPAYSLPGPLGGRMFLPLVSTADHTLPAQTGNSTAPGQLYVDHMRTIGASVPNPLPLVTAAGCDHGDYYRPDRPECGWNDVQSALSTAFR